MAYIPELTVGNFSDAIDNGYTVKTFMFTTKTEAEQNLPTNPRVEPLPTINRVIILQDNKAYFWSAIFKVLIDPEAFFRVGKEGSWFVDCDGDDMIHFTNDGGLLDFSKSWSIGLTYLIQDLPVDGKRVALIQNGQNRIYFLRGGANMGLYFSHAKDQHGSGVNTWYQISYGDKFLFVYDHTTRNLKTYINSTSQVYNITIPAVPAAGEPNGLFSIGKSPNDIGNNWPVEQFKHYHGGVNNFIAMNKVMNDVHISDYFQLSSVVTFDSEGNPEVAGDYMESQAFYPELTCYIPLGEAEYPNVVDKKGLLQGGIFTGLETGFKPVPTSAI